MAEKKESKRKGESKSKSKKRICIIAEGCYPYEIGGVSSWIHSIIGTFPDIEFSLIAIVADREGSGKFRFQLPENLVAVYEVYLNDFEYVSPNKRNTERKIRLSKEEVSALGSLVSGQNVDWECIFRLFGRKRLSVDKLLDRKSTRRNSSHRLESRMPSSA